MRRQIDEREGVKELAGQMPGQREDSEVRSHMRQFLVMSRHSVCQALRHTENARTCLERGSDHDTAQDVKMSRVPAMVQESERCGFPIPASTCCVTLGKLLNLSEL